MEEETESDLDNVIDMLPWRLRNQILARMEDEDIKERIAKKEKRPLRQIIVRGCWRATLYLGACIWLFFWLVVSLLLLLSLIGAPFGIATMMLGGWPLATLWSQHIWMQHTGEKSLKDYKRKLNSK